MCQQDSKIHFCTCSNKQEVHMDFPDEVVKLYEIKKMEAWHAFYEKDGSYESTYFKWTLSSFEKEVHPYSVLGMMMAPQKQIGEQLTIDRILETLNSGNPFDFDYEPQERDVLKIEEHYTFLELEDHRRPKTMKYMPFKYENGQWAFGRYPMHYRHKETEIGKVKTIKITSKD